MTKALVVLSGGQDSTTCLFWAREEFGVDNVHAVTYDYGQRHRIELDAARNVASLAGVADRHTVVSVGPILEGRSPLTNRGVELEQYPDHATMEKTIGDRVEKTFVPMRNALFLTLAANHAVVRDITELVTGVCQADNANYPDCRASFIDRMEAMIDEALGLDGPEEMEGHFKIHTPLMRMTKEESVMFAASIPQTYAALAYSHTAYDGQFPPVGKDHATVLRAYGFLRSGLPDPLILRAWRLGLMQLPNTDNYNPLKVSAAMSLIKDQMAGTGPLGFARWWHA